ncbi:MAG: hypothetical protein ACE5JK_03745, partial [Candidatus Omnitrophota bacterium]
MKRVFVFVCIFVVLSFFLAGLAYSQTLKDYKARVRAEVRREMGLDEPGAPKAQKEKRMPDEGEKRHIKSVSEIARRSAAILMIIALIPAIIAKVKGRSFIAWYVLGLLFFIIVFPVSVFMKKLPKSGQELQPEEEEQEAAKIDVYKKIENLSKLKEKGILSGEE